MSPEFWNNDVDLIYKRLDELVAQPIRVVNRESMKKYLTHFDQKCTKSKEMIDEAQRYIPGGVQHNLAFNYPFPLVITKAEGAYLYDLDENKYIDFLQAGGPTVLGSNYQPVTEKAIELLTECGPSTGLFHENELKIAKEVSKHVASVEMFRMLGSGTESVMAAIRIARLATGKKNIIKIGGAYHGWSDPMVYSLHIPNSRRFEAHGIPKVASKYTREAKPNDIKSLKRVLQFNRIRGGTAAVILEPVGPESGTRPVHFEYNKQVRELCDNYGALLIYDEVVSGFRLSLGGAQKIYDVKPDLTVFGKIIGGGYAGAGGVGGPTDLIEYMAAGVGGGKKRAYVGGTMAANPLTALAGYETIREIERTNAIEKAAKAGDRLTRGLIDIIDRYDLPYVAYNQGSISHLETIGTMFLKIKIGLSIFKTLKEIKLRKHAMEEMGAAYMAEGIVTLAGSRMYTSMASTDQVIDDALVGFENVFKKVDTS